MTGLDIQVGLVTHLLVRFLQVEAGKFGFDRAVLGLSGGVDSAVSTALAARAFGPENVLALLLPYRTSSPASEVDAQRVVELLGVRSKTVDISAMADGYLEQEDVKDRVRRGNVMARSRMIALYDHSAEERALVIGTSNKTEILLGYSTQFGDAASALNPLGDLYKCQVYQLARHLELPDEVIEKAPSADLVPGQTDESDLGFTYEEVDRLLVRMVDERFSEKELLEAGFELDFIRNVAGRIVANQYKRLPPIVAKLSQRTVNQDFRYLRSWGR